MERYEKHIKLKGFGLEGQSKLLLSSVLVIGAGGLGCPALQYLAAAGIGTIGIVDNDLVSLSNLHRQILYTTHDIGKPKAEVAALKLKDINPEIEVLFFVEKINTTNAVQIISQFDLVLDCTDNFPSRYLIDDACRLLKKTCIFAAVYTYEGQVAVFNSNSRASSYRSLFERPPSALDVQNCNEAGVLGVLPGMVGVIQATEAIKIIANIGEPLINKLLTINLLDYETITLNIPTGVALDKDIPSTIEEFEKMDYFGECNVQNYKNINAAEFYEAINDIDTEIIDVRESSEFPKLNLSHLQIPLSDLESKWKSISKPKIVVVCQTGKRSVLAAQFLANKLQASREVSNLVGGINEIIKAKI